MNTESIDFNETHDYTVRNNYNCLITLRNKAAVEASEREEPQSYKQIYKQIYKQKLIESVSKGMNDEQLEFFKLYASLEAEGEEFDGNKAGFDSNSSRNLLKLEEFEGVSLGEIGETNKNVFVATYEVEFDGQYCPMKEFYIKDENGELVSIGNTNYNEKTDSNDTITLKLNKSEITLSSSELQLNNKVNEYTDRQMNNEIQKNELENQIDNLDVSGKITGVSLISDSIFKNEFLKQCGVDDESYHEAYIISAIDENGNESFDVVFESRDGTNISYNHFGINPVESKIDK